MSRLLRQNFARFLVITAISACGSTQGAHRLSYGDSAKQAYEASLEDFNDDNCIDAEPGFKKVKHDFPYSRYAALAELRLADCQYKQGKYAEAIQAYRQFVRARPSHNQVPYARFKVADSYVQQIPTDWLLSPPAYERDQGPSKDALEQLRRFLVDFPDDEHVAEARRMERDALKLLAQHELYVARFYLERDHPESAVLRINAMLTAYTGSGLEPEALLLLGQTYLQMRDRSHARQTFTQLITQYPHSGYAVQAREYLHEI